MAFDPSDLLEPPFCFGECEEMKLSVLATCTAWKDPTHYVDVLIRKEGDRHMVHIPEFLFSSKNGILTKDCDISLELLYPLAEEDNTFKISKCRTRHFTGYMQIYDEKLGGESSVPAAIDYDCESGVFTFEPVTNFPMGTESVAAVDSFNVGILNTTVYIDEEIEEAEIEEVSDIDMDYEDDREEKFEPSTPPTDPDWVTQKMTFTVYCGAWKNGNTAGYKTEVTLSKNAETNPTKGRIYLNPIMYPIAYASVEKSNCEIVFGSSDIETFFGALPSGILGRPELFFYKQNRFESSVNYVDTEGIIYFYNNNFRIAPYYAQEGCDAQKFFTPLPTSAVKQQNIGVKKSFSAEFDIPATKPTYEFLRDNSKTYAVDISKIPYPGNPYTKTVQIRGKGAFWDGEKVGEALLYNDGKNGRIEIEDFMFPVKKTDTLQYSTLQIISDGAFEDFFGAYPPSGTLKQTSNGSANKIQLVTYHPVNKNYPEVAGNAYYYDTSLFVTPDESDIRYYYTLNGSETVSNVGIKSVGITFSRQTTKPTYTDLMNGVSGDIGGSSAEEGEQDEPEHNDVVTSDVNYDQETQTCTVKCNAWEDITGGYSTKLMYEKDSYVGKITFLTEGIDSSMHLMHNIKQSGGVYGSCISINVYDTMSNFFSKSGATGLIPQGELGSCTVYAYLARSTGDSDDYYQEVPGIIYYQRGDDGYGTLCITPKYQDWNFFFPTQTNETEVRQVGFYDSDFSVVFKLETSSTTISYAEQGAVPQI